MTVSVKGTSAQMHLNDVHVRMAKARTIPNPVDATSDPAADFKLLRLVQTAIKRAGLKQSYLASLSDVPESQISGALNGHGNFSVVWMEAWPQEFWTELLALLRAYKEISAEALKVYKREQLIAAVGLLIEVAS